MHSEEIPALITKSRDSIARIIKTLLKLDKAMKDLIEHDDSLQSVSNELKAYRGVNQTLTDIDQEVLSTMQNFSDILNQVEYDSTGELPRRG